jgi:hypothetical protein
LCLALLLSLTAKGQFSLGISVSGIGFHPVVDGNEVFYKWKIDRKGKWVAYSAITVFASYRLSDKLGIKAMQSLVFHDCAGKFTGISHIGIDFHDDFINWTNPVHQFSFSAGPLWYYRRNWTELPGYQNNPSFARLSQSGKWEHKFVWHGGQIEYSRHLSPRQALTVNFLPGYPYLYTFGTGVKFINPGRQFPDMDFE